MEVKLLTYTGNIGYLYYKDYFRNEEDTKSSITLDKDKKVSIKSDISNKNERLLQASIYNDSESLVGQLKPKYTFNMKTTYLGLLIGSGYMHGIGLKDEFKLGFYFDYTTGIPIIPGSSIKGMLRNAFKRSAKSEPEHEYIKDLLIQSCKLQQAEIDNISIDDLEREIFCGEKINDKGNYDTISMYKRDIFFDAVISKSISKNMTIFGDDFITPHSNPLCEPTPLKFIKILPDVELLFSFDLKDGIIKAEKKQELFKQIILDMGVGAKTNVGYGILKEIANK